MNVTLFFFKATTHTHSHTRARARTHSRAHTHTLTHAGGGGGGTSIKNRPFLPEFQTGHYSTTAYLLTLLTCLVTHKTDQRQLLSVNLHHRAMLQWCFVLPLLKSMTVHSMNSIKENLPTKMQLSVPQSGHNLNVYIWGQSEMTRRGWSPQKWSSLTVFQKKSNVVIVAMAENSVLPPLSTCPSDKWA